MPAGQTKPRPLEKPKPAARIVAWLVDGKSTREIVALLAQQRIKTTHQAITAFRKRHQAEIDALTQRVVAVIQDVAIREKSERIRRRSWYVEQLEGVMRERGPLAREPKWVAVYAAETTPPIDKNGEPLPAKQDQDGLFLVKLGEKVIEVERVDAALYKTANELLDAVARELGELPRPADDSGGPPVWTQINVYVDQRTQGEPAKKRPVIIDA